MNTRPPCAIPHKSSHPQAMLARPPTRYHKVAPLHLPTTRLTPSEKTVRHLTLSLASILFSITSAPLLAQTATTPASDIEKLLRAVGTSESQFSTLSMDYTVDLPPKIAEGREPGTLVEVSYAHDRPNNSIYELHKQFQKSPDAKDKTLMPTWSSLTAFDGSRELYMTFEKGISGRTGLYNLIIDPDFNPRHLFIFDAFTTVWRESTKVDFLDYYTAGKPRNWTSTEDHFDNAPATKLAGELFDGTAQLQLWIRPDRSNLPVRYILSSRVDPHSPWLVMQERRLTDLVQLDSNLWFPKTVQCGVFERNWLWTFKIQKLSVAPLDIATFQPAIPPHTHVQDNTEGVTYDLKDDPTHRENIAHFRPKHSPPRRNPLTEKRR